MGRGMLCFNDMGASSTYAALVYFSTLRISDGTQNLEVRLWTSRLVEYFADDINKQVGNGVDGRKFPKAMA
ncbi:hypothetical protein NC651_034833 [Populus alba x Populus x berolinensis]|nr:hypothetical protein NC651_034833 [Populus alba x Populus x berolinensis]